MKKDKLLFLAMLWLWPVVSEAQNISGPTSVNVGETTTYTFNNLNVYPSHRWATSIYGSIASESSNGATYTADVRWTSPGTCNLTFLDDNYIVRGTLSVTVNVGVPNSSFSINQICNSTTITRNTTPPEGVDWYWETSNFGANTSADAFALTYTIGTPQTIFLRAQHRATGIWSNGSQTAGNLSVFTRPSAPAFSMDGAVISNSPINVSLGVSNVTGATQYGWYNQLTGGSPVAVLNSPSYSPLVSTTLPFYVEAIVSNVNGACASATRTKVTAYVYPEPVLTASDNGVLNMRAVTLAVSNFSYDHYAWYLGNNQVSYGSPSVTVTSPGIYTVQVSKGTSPIFISNSVTVTDVGSQNNNFIVSNNILADSIFSDSAIGALPVESNNQTIQYFDGLGRPLQTVVTQGSPFKKDIVQPFSYDQFGRETTKYLPYVSTGNNGFYKVDAIANGNGNSAQSSFYNNGVADKIADDVNPYSVSVFEASPLNRTIKQGAPGSSWQPDTAFSYASTDHTIRHAYEMNGENEVLKLDYIFPTTQWPFGSIKVTNGATYYAANELYKNWTKDEQSNEVIEFKDRRGNLVLKKVFVSEDEWAQTYYVYDDFGNLVFVLPPEGSKAIISLFDNR